MKGAALAAAAAAAALAAPAAHAAQANPAQLSLTATRAIFGGHWHTAWMLLHPKYRAVTTERKWTTCHVKELQSMSGLQLVRLEAMPTQQGKATFPGLGKVPVVVIEVHISYRLPDSGGVQTGVNTAYWTRSGGKWWGLMAPASYRAFKAGRCP